MKKALQHEKLLNKFLDTLEIDYFLFASVSDTLRYITTNSSEHLTDPFFELLHKEDYLWPGCRTPGWNLWPRELIEKLNTVDTDYPITHGVTLVKQLPGGFEAVSFACTAPDSKIIDYFFNLSAQFKAFSQAYRRLLLAHGPVRNNHRIMPEKYLRLEEKSTSHLKNKILDILDVRLSDRERFCLKETLLGKSANTIATELSISSKSVESYINRTKLKLNCANRSELFNTAHQLGILDNDL